MVPGFRCRHFLDNLPGSDFTTAPKELKIYTLSGLEPTLALGFRAYFALPK
jgi:hypothetical protein